MKKTLSALAILVMLGSLSGCAVEPEAVVDSNRAMVEPTYPRPSPDATWLWEDNVGWGWFSPQYGWWHEPEQGWHQAGDHRATLANPAQNNHGRAK